MRNDLARTLLFLWKEYGAVEIILSYPAYERLKGEIAGLCQEETDGFSALGHMYKVANHKDA